MAKATAVKAARKGTEALTEWQVANGPADLSGANLRGCDLRWMNFAGADLTGVDFSESRLTGAYFGPAQFHPQPPHVTRREVPVRLEGASFEGALLLAATFNYA